MYSNTFSNTSIFISKCRIFFCPDQAWNSRSGCSSCGMYSTFTSFQIPYVRSRRGCLNTTYCCNGEIWRFFQERAVRTKFDIYLFFIKSFIAYESAVNMRLYFGMNLRGMQISVWRNDSLKIPHVYLMGTFNIIQYEINVYISNTASTMRCLNNIAQEHPKWKNWKAK
jgi:hypothetical protein